MTQAAANLSKKTKNEILEEYQKLLDKMEDASLLSKSALSPAGSEAMARAKEFDAETIEKEGLKIEEEMASGLQSYLGKLQSLRRELKNRLEEEMKKFQELQAAMEATRQNLKNNYHIEVAAEALNRLIEEYADKKKTLQAELDQLRADFDRTAEAKKAEWERRNNEREYEFNQKKQRAEESLKEEEAQRERQWQEREAKLKAEETEIARLKEDAAKFPEQLAAEVAKKEKETAERLKAEHLSALSFKEQEWKGKEEIYKLKIENLEHGAKKCEMEISNLKKEQELAIRKAQEMAIKVIESGAAKSRMTDEGEGRNAPSH
jgi:hypothetical protein